MAHVTRSCCALDVPDGERVWPSGGEGLTQENVEAMLLHSCNKARCKEHIQIQFLDCQNGSSIMDGANQCRNFGHATPIDVESAKPSYGAACPKVFTAIPAGGKSGLKCQAQGKHGPAYVMKHSCHVLCHHDALARYENAGLRQHRVLCALPALLTRVSCPLVAELWSVPVLCVCLPVLWPCAAQRQGAGCPQAALICHLAAFGGCSVCRVAYPALARLLIENSQERDLEPLRS